MCEYLSVMLPASMSPDHYALMKALFLHFHNVYNHCEKNKMVRSLFSCSLGSASSSVLPWTNMRCSTTPARSKSGHSMGAQLVLEH